MQGESLLSAIFRAQDRFIGLAGQDPEFVGRAHAEQIRAVVRLTPAMMLGNLFSIAAILVAYSTHAALPFLLLWSLVLAFMMARAMRAWLQLRQGMMRDWASPRAIHRATVNAALFGAIWGIMPTIAYPDAGYGQQLVVTAVITGMLSAGSFALSALPRATLVFLIPVTFGSTLALLARDSAVDAVLGFLQFALLAIALLASHHHARMLVAHLKAEKDALEQKSVIGLLLKSFEDHASDWLWHLDETGRFRDVSLRFAEAAGLQARHLEGAHAPVLLRRGEANRASTIRLLLAFRRRRAFRDVEIGLRIRGTLRWWRVSGEPAYDNRGRFTGFRGVGSDVTEARESADRLSYLAHFDGVTGAVNRGRFNELLAGLTVRASLRQAPFALIYVDLDFFKAVNDRHGHRTGDLLLAAVVARLRVLLPPETIIARLGGDEFAIALENPGSEADLSALAAGIIAHLSEPFEIGEARVVIGASLGLVLATRAIPVESLLHQADLALYMAKGAGRRTFRFFRPDMEDRQREQALLEADLAQAITRGELELHYQPFVRSPRGSTAGFEALLRWHHPERGTIPPAIFIPLAEKSSLINRIGDWVLQEACRAAASMPGDLVMAVNLSSRQFEQGHLAADIRAILAETGLAPQRLELEVTESVLIDNPDAVIECLRELKALGIRIAMDDFGTGYSSLSYLWRFPFDKIKIDGAFIAAMTQDQTARDIVQAIAMLTRQLGVNLTAERVETEEEIRFLREIRCDYLQGYFFARPMPLVDAAAHLLTETRRRSRAGHSGRRKHLAA